MERTLLYFSFFVKYNKKEKGGCGMKTLRCILIAVVAVMVVGLLCYQGFVTHELTGTNLMEGILILAGLILTVIRGPRRTRANKKDYKIAYGHLIGDAFSQDPKLEKQLYKALDDFNKRRYPVALRKLEQLRLESARSAEYFTTTVFIAICHSRMGNLEEAIYYYSEALQIQEHTTVASNLGNCYLELGKTDEALECFLRALRADDPAPAAGFLPNAGDYGV